MKVVYEAATLIDAHLVRHALEAAGIPAFVRGEHLLGGAGELPLFGLLAVCVPDVAWPQARDIVATLPLDGAAAGEDEVPGDGVPGGMGWMPV